MDAVWTSRSASHREMMLPPSRSRRASSAWVGSRRSRIERISSPRSRRYLTRRSPSTSQASSSSSPPESCQFVERLDREVQPPLSCQLADSCHDRREPPRGHSLFGEILRTVNHPSQGSREHRAPSPQPPRRCRARLRVAASPSRVSTGTPPPGRRRRPPAACVWV